MAARKKAAPAAPAPMPSPPPPPAFGDFRLDQLGFCQCRYATGQAGGQHRFCGRPTMIQPGNRHGSWCEEHCEIVFVPYQRGGGVVRKAEAA